MRALWIGALVYAGCRASSDLEPPPVDPVEVGSVVSQLEPADAAVSTSVGMGSAGSAHSQTSTVEPRLTSHAGLDFIEVEVSASVGAIGLSDGLESVVLSPLYCEAGVDRVFWPAHSGDVWTRPAVLCRRGMVRPRTDGSRWNVVRTPGWWLTM